MALMERIRMLTSEFINGSNAAANKPLGDEVEIRPLPTQSGRMQGSPYVARTGQSWPKVVSPLASAGIGRLRFGNQGGGFGAEHTRSNLG